MKDLTVKNLVAGSDRFNQIRHEINTVVGLVTMALTVCEIDRQSVLESSRLFPKQLEGWCDWRINFCGHVRKKSVEISFGIEATKIGQGTREEVYSSKESAIAVKYVEAMHELLPELLKVAAKAVGGEDRLKNKLSLFLK